VAGIVDELIELIELAELAVHSVSVGLAAVSTLVAPVSIV